MLDFSLKMKVLEPFQQIPPREKQSSLFPLELSSNDLMFSIYLMYLLYLMHFLIWVIL